MLCSAPLKIDLQIGRSLGLASELAEVMLQSPFHVLRKAELATGFEIPFFAKVSAECL